MLLLVSRSCHSSQEEENTLKPVSDDISHKIIFVLKCAMQNSVVFLICGAEYT